MQSERKYSRNTVLTNDGYYRQKLSNVKEDDGYVSPTANTSFKYGAAIAGLAVTGGSAKALYEDGNARAFIHRFVMDAASSGVADFANVKEAVDETVKGKSLIVGATDLVKNETIPKAFEKSKLQRLKSAETVLENLETIRLINERASVLNKLQRMEMNAKTLIQ